MITIETITTQFNAIDGLLSSDSEYDNITDLITALANSIHAFEGEIETIWYIGEHGEFALDNLIVGAYWHYSEWHGGQWSAGYAALSALGQVFSPGMTMPETDNAAYQALNDLAKRHENNR